MPIYEFYCEGCNTIFNFYSRTINTSKQPVCPRCKEVPLKRLLSSFSIVRKGTEEEGEDSLPFDEKKMEKAVGMLAHEAEHINEEDPRQAAQMMRKLSEMTGLQMGKGMQEALERMEAGEDPEKIEEEIGDILENEEPFLVSEKNAPRAKSRAPRRDTTLYEL
ncbi:MAG: zinc ribbon domain-containing protein [Deltaproteobacteria bacterium]|nr:MAG: zinc ribbon domain-containing protein [Deltaproteobacteria bacterium]